MKTMDIVMKESKKLTRVVRGVMAMNTADEIDEDALGIIAQKHPLDSITDREALDTALWFGSRGMRKWVLEHQRTHPEAWCALEYITALKADPELLGKTVDGGAFEEGLGLLMDEARRDFAFGARICPTFHNIVASGSEVGISDEKMQELAQLMEDIGSFWGFTMVIVGNNVWFAPA